MDKTTFEVRLARWIEVVKDGPRDGSIVHTYLKRKNVDQGTVS